MPFFLLQLQTFRGTVLEESIPSTTRHGASRALPPRDILDFCFPDLQLSCLRLANAGPKVSNLRYWYSLAKTHSTGQEEDSDKNSRMLCFEYISLYLRSNKNMCYFYFCKYNVFYVFHMCYTFNAEESRENERQSFAIILLQHFLTLSFENPLKMVENSFYL